MCITGHGPPEPARARERSGTNSPSQATGETSSTDTLILNFQPLELWDDTFLWCKPSSLWDFLKQSQEYTQCIHSAISTISCYSFLQGVEPLPLSVSWIWWPALKSRVKWKSWCTTLDTSLKRYCGFLLVLSWSVHSGGAQMSCHETGLWRGLPCDELTTLATSHGSE